MNNKIISLTNEFKSFPLIEQVMTLIYDAANASITSEYQDRIIDVTDEYYDITFNIDKTKTIEGKIKFTKELIAYFRRLGFPEYYILYRLIANNKVEIFDKLEDFVYNMMIDIPSTSENKSDGYSEMIKFKMMVEKINMSLMGINNKAPNCGWILQWIYDYPSCNNYAQIILDVADLRINHYDIKLFDTKKGTQTFEDRIKKFIECCANDSDKRVRYVFIFWALLILAVDKTDAEKHLSVLCNFCVMLGIKEAEFEDLIHVVKEILHEETIEYRYKTETVQNIFGSLINQNHYNKMPSDMPKTEYGTTCGHEMPFDAMLQASFSEVKKVDNIPQIGFFGGKKK